MSYLKQSFENGQVLKAEHLNHIEDGLLEESESLYEHKVSTESHNDIRILLQELSNRINSILDSDDTTLDQLSEIVSYIKSNRELIESVTTSKVSFIDIVDNLSTNLTNRPLSAAQGVILKSLIDAIVIPDKVSQLQNDCEYALKIEIPTEPKSIGAEIEGTAESLITEHNIESNSHNDIRIIISELSDRLNAIADSDDTTLDQLSEIVAYIKSNEQLINAITISKVSVSDIIDNLTTNIDNKPLSAKQGAILKSLIDTAITELQQDAKEKVNDVQIDGSSITDEATRVANIQIGSGTNFGVFKLGSGVGASSSGGLMTQPATDIEITNRGSTYKILSPRNLDFSVKSAMCDGKGDSWTVGEQIASQKRIGVGNIELIKEISLSEDVAAIDLLTTEEGIELRECFVFGKVIFTSSGEKQISMYKQNSSGLSYYSYKGICNVTGEHVSNGTPWFWSRFIYPIGETGIVITLEPCPTTESMFGIISNSCEITYTSEQNSLAHIIDSLALRLIGSDDSNLIKAGSTFSIFGRKVR